MHNITGSNSTTVSIFLKRAELSKRGSQVTVRCEFADEYPEASCVLVYRKYNHLHLTLKEYSHSTKFPVAEFFNDIETYTFAVFGKNDKKIEKEPVILLKNEEHVSYPPPQTCKNHYPLAVSSSYKCIFWVANTCTYSMGNTYTRTTLIMSARHTHCNQ